MANFHATITDRKTGRVTEYTQGTLDELKADLKAVGIKGPTLSSNPAAGLKNWRDGREVTSDRAESGRYRVWNPQAAAAGLDRIVTNSFVPVRLTKDEKDWLGKSVSFLGTGTLRQFVADGETEARGTVWSMAPGIRNVWVLTEDRRFALASTDQLILV